MLSRASSDAGVRLRRAKSLTSVHNRRSEPQSLSLDYAQAEAAAVVAYQRAYSSAAPMSQQDQKHVHKLERKKKARRPEGSHFEESRNGGRVIAPEIGALSRKIPTNVSRRNVPTIPAAADKQKSAVFPCSTSQRAQKLRVGSHVDVPRNERISHNTIDPVVRESQPMCRTSISSNVPLNSAKIPLDGAYELSSSVPIHMSRPNSALAVNVVRPSAANVLAKTTGEQRADVVAREFARDSHLQDSHNRKLRTRSSFIDPIKIRLRKAPSRQLRSANYDNSAPPFNCADDGDDVFALPAEPTVQLPPLPSAPLPAPRVFSDTLKNKLRRMIGKGKRVATTLPIQHVEAKQFHFALAGSSVALEGDEVAVPDRPPPDPPVLASINKATTSRDTSACTIGSVSGSQATKSRVTSWTDSSLADTVRAHNQQKRLSSVNERMPYASYDPDSDGRAGSLLGRPFRLPVRRSSRRDLNRSSEDSQRLYNALRRQIEEPEYRDPSSLEAIIDGSPVYPDPVIPSRKNMCQPAETTQIDGSPASKQTIRTVTPENEATRPTVTAQPDQELISGTAFRRTTCDRARLPSQEAPPTISGPDSVVGPSQLSRCQAPTVEVCDGERLSRRYEKSQNRWQTTLENDPLILSRALLYHTDNNPYELSRSPTVDQEPCLPTVIRHRHEEEANFQADAELRIQRPAARHNVVSPTSTYSRPTDYYSTRPNTPHGTIITITGREIKSYSFDNPATFTTKPSEPVRDSNEWKSWLSRELEDFESVPAQEDLTLLGEDTTTSLEPRPETSITTTSSATLSRYCRNQAQCPAKDEKVPDSQGNRPPVALEIRPQKTRRPKLSNRKSSGLMNDRYPVIESGRQSSDKGLRGIRRRVSETSLKAIRRMSSNKKPPSSLAASASAIQEARPPVGRDQEASNDRPMMNRPRSMASIASSVVKRPSNPLVSQTKATITDMAEMTDGIHIPQPPPVPPVISTHRSGSSRTKSALDLRARYKPSSNSLRNSSINIRRKPIARASTPLQFEDQTLQKITQGPYANDQAPLSSTQIEQQTSKQSQPARPSKFDQNGKENTTPLDVGVNWTHSQTRLPSSQYAAGMAMAEGNESEVDLIKGLMLGQGSSPRPTSTCTGRASASASRLSMRPVSRIGQRVRESPSRLSLKGVGADRCGNGSPGQRMAEHFLNSRRMGNATDGNGSSPAFV